MKILFVWTGVTSYMADCWRQLQQDSTVELKIVIAPVASGREFDRQKVLVGLDWTEKRDLGEWKPDLMFIVGWHNPTCRFFATAAEYAAVPKICCFDMPWEWKLRKFAARFLLARYLRNFKAAFVPGAVAAKYARWLGFKDVRTGLFGIDTEKFADTAAERRGFLFVGRLATEKRIDVLAKAYRLYREQVSNPWPLDVYGSGSGQSWLEGLDGVRLHGFVQPDEVRAAFAKAGAFVLASDWDPWPLVIAESCAAGLPVICTDHCWNHGELVHGNGLVCKAENARALAEAMMKMSNGTAKAEGVRGRALVAPYDVRRWTESVKEFYAE